MDELTERIDDVEPEAVEDPKPPRDLTKTLLGVIAVMLAGVLGLQIVQFLQSTDLTNEVAALSEDVTDLKPLRRDVDLLGDQLAALDGQIASAVDAAGASPAAIPTQDTSGALPAFQDSSNDPAVLGAMTLSTIEGPEYYSGAEISLAPTDGKARVWMVWAHWCPYCQAELPELDVWYPENAARFPNVELITVTSAIDDSRDNPLVEYLDTEQFAFPVIVDESGATSQLFGTTAFPFWVVTDAQGTVVLRVAGALDVASVDQIFAQLETMASEA
ncbi:MAG: redoxin domain-containing protein [bacterium]|nr:redoxin domain-containing protein [bacterium]